MDSWQSNIVHDDEDIFDVIEQTRRIAVLGIKTEAQAGQPSIEVPRYMASFGYTIVPVPVYYPEATEILGKPVYRTLAAIEEPVDMVNVFRRANDIPGHLEDILAANPRFVWFQLGIRNDSAAEDLACAGIRVVQDRCLMVDHARARRVRPV